MEYAIPNIIFENCVCNSDMTGNSNRVLNVLHKNRTGRNKNKTDRSVKRNGCCEGLIA